MECAYQVIKVNNIGPKSCALMQNFTRRHVISHVLPKIFMERPDSVARLGLGRYFAHEVALYDSLGGTTLILLAFHPWIKITCS